MNNVANIPTIESISNMTSETLDRFMLDGFAYVKIPNVFAEEKLDKLVKDAKEFFKLPKHIKETKKLDPITLQGYVDRRNEENKSAALEQITFPTNSPIGRFEDHKDAIDVITHTYRYEIVMPLMRAIFHRVLEPLGFDVAKIDQLLAEATDEIFTPMSLLNYPYSQDLGNKEYALPEHVDEDMITVLWVAQDGLQVWLENLSSKVAGDKTSGEWYNIIPKPGYVIVNIGKALSWMLGKKCNAVKHRVALPKTDRLSGSAKPRP